MAEKNGKSHLAQSGGTDKGFTLIELLVVVAIIAVLISILLPALANARESARTAVCKQQFHQVAIGLQGYLGDYRDFLPGYADQYPDPQGGMTLPDGNFYNLIRRMQLHTEWFMSGNYRGAPRDGNGFLGPYMASTKETILVQGSTAAKSSNILVGCPSVQDGTMRMGKWMGSPTFGYAYHYRTFALNYYSATKFGWEVKNKVSQPTAGPIQFSSVPTPAHRAYFCDGQGVQSAYVIAPETISPYMTVADYSALAPDPRHANQTFNVLLFDGHVESGTWATHFTRGFFPYRHDDP